MISRDSYVLRAFLASTLLGITMVLLAFGLIQVFMYGPTLPYSVILVITAISFVLFVALFERYQVGSIAASLLVSVLSTALLTTLSGGVVYLMEMSDIRWEDAISALALSMMLSMALLSYLKRSLGRLGGY
ncbi:MAG TPA: hypothetical protein PK659_03920 [Methanothrix sp.]|nr:hypothetical protein [Methanothrix sp.]HOK57985.1 hypothetical protein [Methanothrix sp.]HOL43388.1 hypothetical protein [Methanothrix sp.]HPO88391.1 hypothetical protein [Methanothrix sp.]